MRIDFSTMLQVARIVEEPYIALAAAGRAEVEALLLFMVQAFEKCYVASAQHM